MLPTSTTRAASRFPFCKAVQTSIPALTSMTRTSPLGVAINVLEARQIGHGGGPEGVFDVTFTTPSIRTVPLTSTMSDFGMETGLASDLVSHCDRNSKSYSSPFWVSGTAR